MRSQGPGWREVAVGALGLLTFSIGLIGYASDRFAIKTDIESRLARIESKIDCLIDSKFCK